MDGQSEMIKASPEDNNPRKPQCAGKVSGWYSLPLEIRQMILRQALEFSLPQKDPEKQLLCLLKSLVKTSYSFGQDEALQPMSALAHHLHDVGRVVIESAYELNNISRRIIEEQGLPRGHCWMDPAHWPYCSRRNCPECRPYLSVTKLYHDQVVATVTIMGCEAALGEAFWRLDQMRGHREWPKVTEIPNAGGGNAENAEDSETGEDRADSVSVQWQQSLPIAKRKDRISKVRAHFDRSVARFTKL